MVTRHAYLVSFPVYNWSLCQPLIWPPILADISGHDGHQYWVGVWTGFGLGHFGHSKNIQSLQSQADELVPLSPSISDNKRCPKVEGLLLGYNQWLHISRPRPSRAGISHSPITALPSYITRSLTHRPRRQPQPTRAAILSVIDIWIITILSHP